MILAAAHPLLGWSLAIGLAAVVLLAFWTLARESGSVHGELDKLKQRAESAVSLEDLKAVETSLITFANQRCWHHHFGTHARQVLAYIQGRKKGAR